MKAQSLLFPRTGNAAEKLEFRHVHCSIDYSQMTPEEAPRELSEASPRKCAVSSPGLSWDAAILSIQVDICAVAFVNIED